MQLFFFSKKKEKKEKRFNIFNGCPRCQMFCRTQWPSPEEYSQLEVQTSLGRTDIVRWFKDHRSALKNGEALGWMGAFQNPTPRQKTEQEQNGRGCEDVSAEVKPAHGELWTVGVWKRLVFVATFLILHLSVQRTSLVRRPLRPSCPSKTKSSG